MSRILGVNRRCYPSEGNLDSVVVLTVILVPGEIGDYAAYAGQGSDEWIAKRGDKLSFEEACIHFPGGQLKREKYRD